MRRGIAHTAPFIFGIAVLLAAGTVVPALGQDYANRQWGVLYSTEQTRTRLADDPTAGASVVFDKGLITVGPGFKFTFERHRRVQIFRNDASRFANVEIPYHKSEKIEMVEAHTLTRDGRRVKVEPRQFYENKTGDWRQLVFAFPEVTPGCVVEYRYRLVSRNFYYLRPWVFQNEVPCEYSELAVRLPEGFEYTAVVNNAAFVHGPDTLEVTSMRHNNQKVRQFTWYTQNLPPLTIEPLVCSPLDHRVLLDFQIVRYRDGQHIWEFVDTWADLADQVGRAYDPLLRAGDDWPVWSPDPALAMHVSRERALVSRVYRFVRDSVATTMGESFSVYHGGLTSARKVFDRRRGSPIEKNLLLVALLRHHGLSAWPILISRRSHLRFDNRDHRLEQFDHVIVMIAVDGERLFCETNVPNAWLGLLPPDDQVDAGIMIGSDDHDEIVVELPGSSAERVEVADAVIDLRADGSATGRLDVTLRGLAAHELICALADNDTLNYLHRQWLPGIVPTAITVARDVADVWAPVRLTVSFNWPEAAQVDDDRLFVRPASMHELARNPLMTQKRRYPISFDSPWSEDCRIVWHLPEGYRFNEPPQPRELAGDGFEFRSGVHLHGNEIVVTRFWQVTRRDFSVLRFGELRDMFATVKRSQRDLVVLYNDSR